MTTPLTLTQRWLFVAVAGAFAGGLAVVLQPSGLAQSGNDLVRATLRKGKPTVVEFGANACAACREMTPVLSALSEQYHNRIEVLDVDIPKQREYIGAYRVQAMPSQVFFDASGRKTGRNLGAIGAREILDRLQIVPVGG